MAESQTQGELFHEDIYDAFRHAVKALGGAKKVGAKLWPEKPMEQGAQLLLHCLNPERPEKLDLYQIEWLLREANKKGCHIAMQQLARDTHYDEPQPIDPEDEKAALQRLYIESVRSQGDIARRLERLMANDQEESIVRRVK